jgi:hypothetical protein
MTQLLSFQQRKLVDLSTHIAENEHILIFRFSPFPKMLLGAELNRRRDDTSFPTQVESHERGFRCGIRPTICAMSAIHPKADIPYRDEHVRFVPKADIGYAPAQRKNAFAVTKAFSPH